MKMAKPWFALACVAACILLTACGGGGSDSGSDVDSGTDNSLAPDSVKTATLNATSNSDYVYFNLATGNTVSLTAAEAENSADWHIAFRRNAVKLNGGASGPGNVAAAVVVAQDDFYDAAGKPIASVFLNATAASELEHLTATLAAPSSLQEDGLVTVLTGSGAMTGMQLDMGWYWYNVGTHALSANDGNGWLLRSGAGDSFARFRTTALTFSPATGLDVTFEFDVQPSGTVQFTSTATFTAHLDASGGETCFDFDSDSAIACTGSEWDLKMGLAGRDLYLRSNGGVSGSGAGGAFGPIPWSGDLDTYTSATIAPDSTPIASLYTRDSTSGVFADQLWYGYDLDGTHKLHPNYRVYWIDTDTTQTSAPKFALQIIGYYSDSGTSGNPKLRWRAIDN